MRAHWAHLERYLAAFQGSPVTEQGTITHGPYLGIMPSLPCLRLVLSLLPPAPHSGMLAGRGQAWCDLQQSQAPAMEAALTPCLSGILGSGLQRSMDKTQRITTVMLALGVLGGTTSSSRQLSSETLSKSSICI